MTQGSRHPVPTDSVESTLPLSREQIEQSVRTFHDTGYVVLRNVVSQEKLGVLQQRIREAFETGAEDGSLFEGGGLISGHLNCFPGEDARFAYDTLKAQGVLDIVAALQPKAVNAVRAGCNLNLPKSVAQHYHADGTFVEAYIVVNVAVVDTDLENGAIDLLPGTHTRFYEFWRYAMERLYLRTTRVPMKRGDVLVRSSVLWHRGMPNLTNNARPMLAFTFGDKGPFHDDPFQAEGGKIKFYPNWYRPTKIGRLRERIFVAAPISYSAYRFARSLFGNKGYAA